MSLQQIQEHLNAPKNQYNNFGKYKYRNLEDILQALKPLLAKYQYSLVISDSLALIGERYYIKATVSLYNEKMELITHSSAYAREELSKKGMDASQLSGATSSYARKYALNGLFLIDDSQDADTQDNTQHATKQEVKLLTEPMMKKINTLISLKGQDREHLKAHYKVSSLKELDFGTASALIDWLEKL